MSPHSEMALESSDAVDFVLQVGNGISATGNSNGRSLGGQDVLPRQPAPEAVAANGHGSGSGRHAVSRAPPPSPYLAPAADAGSESEYDLVCVGFGPASLAVAIAMHDALAAGERLLSDGSPPKVLFVEKQTGFAWHAGMLLPGAKMQISFIKDLASLRDPRSEFTFLNYLHTQGRLVDFTNLGTFLPARVEYEDYLRWCASHFDRLVRFGQEVVSVSPVAAAAAARDGQPVRSFAVESRDVATGHSHVYRARNVLLATGGQPSLPKSFPLKHPRVIHSSEYAYRIRQILPKANSPYRVAVVGAGQSAAEIFNNLQMLYPNSKTWLVMRPEFLRPSDDSPFVNSVFNPEYVDNLFPKSAKYRNSLLTEARATNYGVVRLNLIEELYERMYEQRRELGPDERRWPHRILGGRQITRIESRGDGLELKAQFVYDGSVAAAAEGFVDAAAAAAVDDEETLEADLVIAATGYKRNAHVEMLRGAWDMLPKSQPTGPDFGKGISGWNVETDQGERNLAVGRDYKVKFSPGAVADESGIWLQGCCEGSHGLSDTLLSVLATRSGEIVESIFGDRSGKNGVNQAWEGRRRQLDA
ncbi:l-lysine 6-monooxygenase (NADPH-requiring) domain-containing protein [Hirsutella rhossiliensis]|uniref:L-ornithine N(5)-monooxygenase [NAD(P)H] n=1 Tax=Hirsutella rhossiliensis TaxID=111463 RepID=A0A9P8SF10_9HYPO|nr:l-lysine 6-monooxygenase (NADPH-requiring) domain-containing protein [Hirsutella rhossiliensis]KAH0958536.1 l-lysine 6-monooxygenase (NADPH-requiring) domain-containing protein [Hirsutella rhossiliensis]